jgi:hypothetical protein
VTIPQSPGCEIISNKSTSAHNVFKEIAKANSMSLSEMMKRAGVEIPSASSSDVDAKLPHHLESLDATTAAMLGKACIETALAHKQDEESADAAHKKVQAANQAGKQQQLALLGRSAGDIQLQVAHPPAGPPTPGTDEPGLCNIIIL